MHNNIMISWSVDRVFPISITYVQNRFYTLFQGDLFTFGSNINIFYCAYRSKVIACIVYIISLVGPRSRGSCVYTGIYKER